MNFGMYGKKRLLKLVMVAKARRDSGPGLCYICVFASTYRVTFMHDSVYSSI